MRTPRLRSLAAGSLLAALAFPGLPAAGADEPMKATRVDLARAYLRFEHAFAEASPTGEALADVNRAFDRATLAFFAGQRTSALRGLDDLARGLTPTSARAPAVLDSLAARIVPGVLVAGDETGHGAEHEGSPEPGLSVRLASLYPVDVPGSAPLPLAVRLVGPGGAVRWETTLEVPPGPAARVQATFRIPAENLAVEPATYTLEVSTEGRAPRPLVRAVRASRSLDARRVENEARLAAVTPDHPSLRQAVSACRARNRLLSDEPSETRSASFLADPLALASSVDAEIAALLDGKNPYRRRVGTWWRTVVVDSSEIPVSVHAPPQASGDAPLPVLVALHGAGGDENMFMEAYGAGALRRLADAHGFLLLSVATMSLLANPGLVHGVVAAVAEDYAIDRTRVHVLGHSLGAMVASRLAANGKGAVASACCFAGGLIGGLGPDACPTLVVAGEIDPLAGAGGMKATSERARARGAPVEFLGMAGYGHTLVVGAALPDAVTWLLSHRGG